MRVILSLNSECRVELEQLEDGRIGAILISEETGEFLDQAQLDPRNLIEWLHNHKDW